MRNLPTEPPPSSDVLDLCCGGRKCPSFKVEGDSIVVTDLEQSPTPIRFAKSDVPAVIAFLSKIGPQE